MTNTTAPPSLRLTLTVAADRTLLRGALTRAAMEADDPRVRAALHDLATAVQEAAEESVPYELALRARQLLESTPGVVVRDLHQEATAEGPTWVVLVEGEAAALGPAFEAVRREARAEGWPEGAVTVRVAEGDVAPEG